MRVTDASELGSNMQHKRSIGVLHQNDWQEVIDMLEQYLKYVQLDMSSTNNQINEVKLMIHKLEHHIDLPSHQSYSFNRWS